MSKLIVVADSSQLARFSECPMAWNLENQENLALAADVTNVPMVSGTYGHKLLDIFYCQIAKGENRSNAMDCAIEHDPEKEAIANGETFSLDPPQRELVKQRFREYCYTYVTNDFIPKSPAHVEIGFSEPVYESTDKLYVLEGRIDLIGSLQGLECAVDHKFQMRSRDIYAKTIQFRNYAMITKTNMLVVNYIRLTKGISKDTFARKISSFTPYEHQVWKQRVIRMFDNMADAMRHGYYEQRWDACSGKYGYPCPFTQLCEQADSQLIQVMKQTRYTERKAWKPW